MPTSSRFRAVRRDLNWPNPEMTLRDAQRCIERDILPAYTSQRFEFCELCANQPDQVAILDADYFQWHDQLRLQLLADLARRIAKQGHMTLLCESKKEEESDDSSTSLDDKGGSNIPPDSGEEGHGHDPVEKSASETSEQSPDANGSDPEEPDMTNPAEDADSEDSDDGEDGDEETDGDSSDSDSGSQDSKNSDDSANSETTTSEGRSSQSSSEASRSDTSCETSSSLSDSSDNRNDSSQDGDHTASNTTTMRHDSQIEQSFTSRTNDTAHETTSTRESDSNAGDECLPKETGEVPNGASEMAFRYQSPLKGQGRQVSRRSKQEHGGVYAYMEDADISSSHVNQIRRAFTTLIGGEVDEGPRWDIRRLVKRTTTYRTPYPARKIEHGRPAILILPDVSGSCSSFTYYTMALSRAASTLGVPGADVIVVSHSNGNPKEYSVNSYKPTFVSTHDAMEFYENLIKRHNIQFVVCIGDMDAAWLYNMILQKVQAHNMVWLDNYACNFGAPRRATVSVNEFPELSKVRYWNRCKDSDDFIDALKRSIIST